MFSILLSSYINSIDLDFMVLLLCLYSKQCTTHENRWFSSQSHNSRIENKYKPIMHKS